MGISNTTLTSAITSVRSLLDEPEASAAPFWSDTEITTWLNQGCADVQRRAEIIQEFAIIAAVVNQQKYIIPNNVHRIHRVEFAPTSSVNTYTLEFRGYNEMDQIWGINQQWPASYPLYYTLWKSPPLLQMVTYPVTAQAGVFNIFYYRTIQPVVNSTDTLDTLPGWEDIIYDYAVYMAFRKDADARWQEAKSIYEAHLNDMSNVTRTFQDQGNYFSTGQVALPAWLINDDMGW